MHVGWGGKQGLAVLQLHVPSQSRNSSYGAGKQRKEGGENGWAPGGVAAGSRDSLLVRQEKIAYAIQPRSARFAEIGL